MLRLLQAHRLAARWRTALAVLLGVVALGVVGMHLLSTGHQLAVPSAAVLLGDHAHLDERAHQHNSVSVEGAVTVSDHLAADPVDPAAAAVGGAAQRARGPVVGAVQVAAPSGGASGCVDCGHNAMFGACLLAFTFGVLWRLLVRSGRSWLSVWTVGLMAFRVSLVSETFSPALRRAGLTHGELSISRT